MVDWWLRARERVLNACLPMFVSLIALVTRCIWLELNARVFHAMYSPVAQLVGTIGRHTLLQNTFVVSAGKVSLVSALQADTIYTIRKRRSF
jgi:hypothetical protein